MLEYIRLDRGVGGPPRIPVPAAPTHAPWSVTTAAVTPSVEPLATAWRSALSSRRSTRSGRPPPPPGSGNSSTAVIVGVSAGCKPGDWILVGDRLGSAVESPWLLQPA